MFFSSMNWVFKFLLISFFNFLNLWIFLSIINKYNFAVLFSSFENIRIVRVLWILFPEKFYDTLDRRQIIVTITKQTAEALFLKSKSLSWENNLLVHRGLTAWPVLMSLQMLAPGAKLLILIANCVHGTLK